MVGQVPAVFTRYNLLLLGEAALTTLLLSAVGCLVGAMLLLYFSSSISWPASGFTWRAASARREGRAVCRSVQAGSPTAGFDERPRRG